jgi:molybdenum cofactor cytidylyltransferase
LLAKGHVISNDDARMLAAEGLSEVWVTELEEGEIGEEDAVIQVASEIGSGSLDIRLAAGGRANLFATEPCCLLVDNALLKQINRSAGIAIATILNFSYVKAGQRVATVKSTPFAIGNTQLDAVRSIIRKKGPILQVRPIRSPEVALLYTDAGSGERARQLFEGSVRERLDNMGTGAAFSLTSVEEEAAVARSLQHLLRVKPTVVLVASTTAPAGPDDVVGRAMLRAGCRLERFLAPVEPGNLLLLAYKDEVPVLSAPGCFRSCKPNVVDFLLPPMLAQHRVSGCEIASLGHGGLLA